MALIISRKVGEAIIIDGPARVFILRVQGSQVKLGIDGGAKVIREELLLP